jgi:glycosyltransferase involved in cell wall biosynthesis
MRHASHIFVANSETEHLVKKVRGTQHGISRLMAAFFSTTKVEMFTRFVAEKNLSGPLRLFAGGNLEGRKGVALALHALARVKKAGVKFNYRLGGKGPEFRSLQNLATRLGLQDDILFGESLAGEDYSKELGSAHIFLLPSFRESAGLTMMEAMLAGCVPVVADCGGPGNIVTEDCGYKIPAISHEQMVAQLAEIITTIDGNRKIIREKGLLASQRIATDFSETNYRNAVNAVYKSAMVFEDR